MLENKVNSGAFHEHLFVTFLLLSLGVLDAFAERGEDILAAAIECGGSYGYG